MPIQVNIDYQQLPVAGNFNRIASGRENYFYVMVDENTWVILVVGYGDEWMPKRLCEVANHEGADLLVYLLNDETFESDIEVAETSDDDYGLYFDGSNTSTFVFEEKDDAMLVMDHLVRRSQ
jgi:hypothetical protein